MGHRFFKNTGFSPIVEDITGLRIIVFGHCFMNSTDL